MTAPRDTDRKSSARSFFRGLRAWVVAAGIAACAAGAEPLPPVLHPDAEMTSKAEAERIVHTFLKCWETGDASTFAGLLDESVVFAYPGGRFDKAGLLQTFQDYHLQKKDIRIYFSDFFISDGYRHVGSYQFAATDRSTGLRFAVGTGVICRIKNGKITQFKEYWDNEVPGRQKLGELPLDEGMTVAPWPCSVLLREEKIN
jgi:ketosteroid isomerase-like protein